MYEPLIVYIFNIISLNFAVEKPFNYLQIILV